MHRCFIRPGSVDFTVQDKVWRRANESMHLGMLDGKTVIEWPINVLDDSNIVNSSD